MDHTIKKQIINLTVNNRMDAFSLQHRVSSYNQKEIIPLLQKIFDELCPEDQTIYLDKLEIDLGQIKIKEIENDQWATLLEKILREKLNKLLRRTSGTDLILREPEMLGICRQWLFYMEKGYLPWNARRIDENWYVKVLEAFATDYASAEQLRFLLGTNEKAIQRIIRQHPVSFLISLVELLTAEKQSQLHHLAEEFSSAIKFFQEKEGKIDPVSNKNLERGIWAKILSVVTHAKTKLPTEKIIGILIPFYFDNIQINQLADFSPIISSLSVILPVLKSMKKDLTKMDEENKQIKKDDLILKTDQVLNEADETIQEKIEEENLIFQDSEGKPPQQNIPEKLAIELKQELITVIGKEEIFVLNAGVVLLHPFINSFFNILNIVSEGKFLDHGLHQKALLLVHFLATGRTRADEHELAIAKILCAYPLHELVDTDCEFSAAELSEADNLLVVAIARWEILKNTSPSGLREGFLQRSGKLQVKNEKVHLQVETSSIDMLLDHLPWNLGMIKLPWMNNILYVEWR